MYHIQTPYLDADGLALLADEANAVTTEFENVPADALRQLATRRPVAPGGDAVAVCQDRAAEKAHFRASGVPCAPFAVIDSEADLAGVLDDLLPGILKTARLGYDGKGQVRVTDRAALEAAWSELGRVPACWKSAWRWLRRSASSWPAAPRARWCSCRCSRTCTATASWP
jgi:5-(carboxyamino)imidazole ribonucleotide synthase